MLLVTSRNNSLLREVFATSGKVHVVLRWHGHGVVSSEREFEALVRASIHGVVQLETSISLRRTPQTSIQAQAP